MKHEAITRRELPRLIHKIRTAGRFQGTRGGHHVEIEIEPSLTAEPIKYKIFIRHHRHSGHAATVAAAVDEINRLSRRSG